jgi:carbamoyl-phosphate synthase large subunit
VDKLEFYHAMMRLGLPAIPTWESLDRVEAATCVVKERFGAGARGVGLNLSRETAAEWASGLQSPIFQPFVEGREHSVDVYVDRRGNAKGAVARSRDLVVGGESQVTTTRRDEALERLCASAAERLRLYGHSVFQVLQASDGGYSIIECNARFGGASSLSVEAGLDSFYWFLLEASGQDVSEYPFFRSACELRQVRYPDDQLTVVP